MLSAVDRIFLLVAPVDRPLVAIVKSVELAAHHTVDDLVIVEDRASRAAELNPLILDELRLADGRGAAHVAERELLERVLEPALALVSLNAVLGVLVEEWQSYQR